MFHDDVHHDDVYRPAGVMYIDLLEASLGCIYQQGKASLYSFNLPFSQFSGGTFVILLLYQKRLVD